MKTFNAVYNKAKDTALQEKQVRINEEHAQLIAAIKSEYGVNDFSKLNESERTSYKTLISEMWTRDNGLNESGKEFIKNRVTKITKDSTEQQVEDYFKKKLKGNINKCMTSFILGQSCDFVLNLKKDIEEAWGKKINDNKCKKWMFSVCGNMVAESIKAIEF